MSSDPSIPFDTLSLDNAISRIICTLQTSEVNSPFALLLGSGFSFPVIPTASQVVEMIPTWLYNKIDPDQDLQEFKKTFWQRINTAQQDLVLDPSSRLPDLSTADNTIAAYQGAMFLGLNDPSLRRAFLRHVIKETKGKINPAHLYLADILDRQHQKDWKYTKNKFCGKIFTTNFDPLLQSSLQLVNKLYWMTDNPDSSHTPTDDNHDAIHLVYTHGNTHQYRMANTEDEITNAAQVQAPKLQPYFQQHGVIVIGYSGWNDTCMTALEQCNLFDHNLYWCDIHPPHNAPDKLRKDVVKLLTKHKGHAFYVHIDGADGMMSQLHRELGLDGVPSFLLDPLAPLMRQIESVVVSEDAPREENELGDTLKKVINRTTIQLKAAQAVFDAPEKQTDVQPDVLISKTMNDALKSARADHLEDAIKQWSVVIEMDGVPEIQRAEALYYRAIVYGQLAPPLHDKAIEDYTAVIQMSDAPADQKAKALYNRGVKYGQLDPPQHDKAIEDYTAVIQMSDAPADQKAKAQVNRGVNYGQLNPPQHDKAIEDYTAVIQMSDAPADQKAKAQVNRGATYGQLDPPLHDKAIEDYTAVIQLPDAPTDQRATALYNRGVKYGQLDPPQHDKAIEDYTAVIQMSDAPADQKAKAQVNRGATYGQLDPPLHDKAIEDYTAVIQMSDAPADQKAKAQVNRGTTYDKLTPPLHDKAIGDYAAVIQMPDAPADQKAQAQVYRGLTFGQLDPPLHDKEIEDYTAVIQMDDAPADQKAMAQVNRGMTYGKLDPPQHDKEIEDYTAVIQMNDAPAEQRVSAYTNLGWEYYEQGNYSASIEASRAGLDLAPEEICARANLGLALLRKGDTRLAQSEYKQAIAEIQTSDDLERMIRHDLRTAMDQGEPIAGAEEIMAWIDQRDKELQAK